VTFLYSLESVEERYPAVAGVGAARTLVRSSPQLTIRHPRRVAEGLSPSAHAESRVDRGVILTAPHARSRPGALTNAKPMVPDHDAPAR
jgi:hypothetical protein